MSLPKVLYVYWSETSVDEEEPLFAEESLEELGAVEGSLVGRYELVESGHLEVTRSLSLVKPVAPRKRRKGR